MNVIKRTPIILILLFPFGGISAQGSFSKIIDMKHSIYNSLVKMELGDDCYYILNTQLCKNEAPDSFFHFCTSLAKFDMNANLLTEILIDSLVITGHNSLLLSNDTLFITGHLARADSIRATMLFTFDSSLSFIGMHQYPFPESGGITYNEGINKIGTNFYIYGSALSDDKNVALSNIIKISHSKNDIIWDHKFARSSRENGCFNLQPLNDNLVFIHHFNSGVGAGTEYGYQIVLIDSFGIKQDSFEYEDITTPNPRLLVSKNNDIYFTSQDPPYPHIFPSNGRINKLKSNLDSLEWSLELPSNPFIDAHKYRVRNLLEAKNGDILVCGEVWEEGPDGPLENQNNHTWNGFIARISIEGSVEWLRVYRHPNKHPLLPSNQFGSFMFSVLNTIHELPNGNIVTGGTVYYGSDQFYQLPQEDTKSFIWLMEVDASGCLQNEECDSVIVIDNKRAVFQHIDIGTKWTFETVDVIIPGYRAGSITYEITDTAILDGLPVFVIENNLNGSKEYLHLDGQSMYYWDEELDTFQLNYVFDSIPYYKSNWKGQCAMSEGIATINIDSIDMFYFGEDSILTQNVTISNNGSTEDDIYRGIYYGIGQRLGGLKLQLGLGLCDFYFSITKLRCFESQFNTYNFVGYACDSTWFSTPTQDLTDNIQIKIIPNPSNGLLNISIDQLSGNALFHITDLQGKVLKRQKVNAGKNIIDLNLAAGMYIYTISSNGRIIYSEKHVVY